MDESVGISLEQVKESAIPLAKSGSTAGVYLLFYKGEVVYVGQSVSPFTRIQVHVDEGVKTFDSYYVIHCDRGELNDLEADCIVKFQPRFNTGTPACSKYVNISQIRRDYRLRDEDIQRLIDNHEIKTFYVSFGKRGRQMLLLRADLIAAIESTC